MSWFAHAVACSLYALGFGAYCRLVLDAAGVHFASWAGLSLETAVGLSAARQEDVLASLIAIAILALVRAVALAAVSRRVSDTGVRYRLRKTFGLLSAGVAIALKDLVANFAGWAFILLRRPFVVGDRIQIGEHAGDVIDVRVFQFTLLEIGNWVDADQSTGRMIHVPNGKVLSDVLANYTKGFRYIWNDVPVLVTFESNWREAKASLERIATQHAASVTGEAARQIEEASQRFMIVYNKLTPAVYTSVRDSGVLLTIRYLCDPRQRRMTTEAIWEDVLTEFAERTDIDFAYPTTRFYDDTAEGNGASHG